MSIGNVIQRKRKELGYTQAQIADRLGVTTPAVNKWEKDISCPDVAILPPLARLLGIDMNELFSFYELLTESEIEEISSSIFRTLLDENKDSKEETYQKMLCIIDEAVKKNPSDPALHKALADDLAMITELDASDKANILIKRSTELYESALTLSPDWTNGLAEALIVQYNKLHEYEKAEAAWELISDTRTDKAWIHAEMLYGQGRFSEASKEMSEHILSRIVNLSLDLSIFSNSLRKQGARKKSKLAEHKRDNLIDSFELWDGLNALYNYAKESAKNNKSSALQSIAKLWETSNNPIQLTTCALFDDVSFTDNDCIAATMNSLIEDLNNKKW